MRFLLRHLLIALTALTLAACNLAGTEVSRASSTPRQPTPTLFIRPSATDAPLPTDTWTPTLTPTITLTPTKTSTPLPTITRTPTPRVRATARATSIPATPALTATPRSAAWSTGVGGGRHGVTGQLFLNLAYTTYRVTDRISYTMQLQNTTGVPVKYGVLGLSAIALEGGGNVFSTAWNAEVTPDGFIQLAPGPFRWTTYIKITAPGRYNLRVAMCFSRFSDCLGPSGDWEELSPTLNVEVLP